MTTTIQDKAIKICERLSCHEILDDDAACLQQEWDCDPRWRGIHRPYSPEEVLKLRGTLKTARRHSTGKATCLKAKLQSSKESLGPWAINFNL
jgi:isocitrate lyase